MEKTNVVLVTDESGSMQPFTRAVIEQAQKQLNAIPRGNPVKFIQFSTYTQRCPCAPTPHSYRASGGTALWDAIDGAIMLVDDGRTPALVIILTDGEENSSTVVSGPTLAKRIRQLQATDRWTFAFQVPKGYKNALVRQLGIPSGNVTEWEQTDEDFARVSHSTQVATESYFATRATGATSTSNFYTTDLSNIAPKDLNSLDRVPAKSWVVAAEQDIRTFVEGRGVAYKPGRAAYQLTKPEIVQAYKKIFIAEKGKKTFYGGKNTRNLLGLPYTDAKIVPGNHASYDIFVESRSFNRKLVRGTRVVWVN